VACARALNVPDPIAPLSTVPQNIHA